MKPSMKSFSDELGKIIKGGKRDAAIEESASASGSNEKLKRLGALMEIDKGPVNEGYHETATTLDKTATPVAGMGSDMRMDGPAGTKRPPGTTVASIRPAMVKLRSDQSIGQFKPKLPSR